MWDHNSSTRNQTLPFVLEAWSLNHLTAREVTSFLLCYTKLLALSSASLCYYVSHLKQVSSNYSPSATACSYLFW